MSCYSIGYMPTAAMELDPQAKLCCPLTIYLISDNVFPHKWIIIASINNK